MGECYCKNNFYYISRYAYWSRASVCLSLSLCVSVRRRMPTLLHGPGCNLRNSRGCSLVVHYWADLQSVNGFRCYGNIARTRNVSECLYSLYAWCKLFITSFLTSYAKSTTRTTDDAPLATCMRHVAARCGILRRKRRNMYARRRIRCQCNSRQLIRV